MFVIYGIYIELLRPSQGKGLVETKVIDAESTYVDKIGWWWVVFIHDVIGEILYR